MKSNPIVIEETYQASVETVWDAITNKDKMKKIPREKDVRQRRRATRLSGRKWDYRAIVPWNCEEGPLGFHPSASKTQFSTT